MPRARDCTNQRFGRWTALSRTASQTRPNGKGTRGVWLCICDCGNTAEVVTTQLTSGTSRSCGCLKDDVHSARLTTHGGFGTKEYGRWARMLDRCRNPANNRYARYGGRGIKVCQQWHDFDRWLSDINNSIGTWPGKGWTLDRYPNPDGDYEPGNVRWATAKMQRANRGKPAAKPLTKASPCP